MPTDTRVLILPGRGDSGDRHWQTFWEHRHPNYRRVIQRDWDSPDVEEWVNTLQQAIAEEDSPTVLIAHSLSVALVAHWALRHAGAEYRGPVKGALLVAPSDVDSPSYPAGTCGFAPMPLLPLPFKSILVASTDDERVTVDRASQFAAAWGSRLLVPGAFGHLGSQAELAHWPYGYALLQTLIEQP